LTDGIITLPSQNYNTDNICGPLFHVECKCTGIMNKM